MPGDVGYLVAVGLIGVTIAGLRLRSRLPSNGEVVLAAELRQHSSRALPRRRFEEESDGHHISLLTYTDQGIKNAKQAPKRIAARKAAPDFGCKLVSCHPDGSVPYDAVAVVEGKNDESVAAFSLAIAGQGNVGTMSMRAFTETELKRIVRKLP